MDTELRNKDDEIMAELKTDIKALKTSQRNTQKSIDSLNSTMADFIKTNEVEHTYIKRGLFGDEEFNEEGLVKKVDRHEQTIIVIEKVFSNARLLWTMAGILGVSTLKDLFEILKPVIEKVVAGN